MPGFEPHGHCQRAFPGNTNKTGRCCNPLGAKPYQQLDRWLPRISYLLCGRDRVKGEIRQLLDLTREIHQGDCRRR